MLRNLASSLFLTERDAELDTNPPKVKGRIVTTLHKAKEVRPLVERCITIARRSLVHTGRSRTVRHQRPNVVPNTGDPGAAASGGRSGIRPSAPRSPRGAGPCDCWETSRPSRILFDEIAPRFADRPGGYTRILKLAKPRLGDAGPRAILEFVGQHDRVTQKATRPAFEEQETASDTEDTEAES